MHIETHMLKQLSGGNCTEKIKPWTLMSAVSAACVFFGMLGGICSFRYCPGSSDMFSCDLLEDNAIIKLRRINTSCLLPPICPFFS